MQPRRQSNLTVVVDLLADWRRSHASVLKQARAAPFCRDMVAFLMFVRDNNIIGTSVTGNMPLKAVADLSFLLSQPRKLEVKIGDRMYRPRSEYDVWPIFVLHVVADVGGMIRTGRSRAWKLTVQGQQFLEMDSAIQLAYSLAVYWHRVNWLLAYPVMGMGEELPYGFSIIALDQLCQLSAEINTSFIGYADALIEATGLVWTAPESTFAADMLRRSIERMIVEMLVKCGAVKCRYRRKTSLGMTVKELTTIQLTPLGSALLEAVALVHDRDLA